ncbi:BatD family protein [Aridibaculum aurantiacum]|uniref:BatD family protein n=1 Tax=Aridibaculum aurantiacum TaxID=2810307 RepID=UPI001A9713F2|nr:BatD family protein [Aridibaculum aurantiacum]
MKAFYAYFLFIFLIVGQVLSAQSFTARVSAKVIGKNDRLQVQYVGSDGDLTQFRMPDFPGWMVIAGPNITSSKTVVNGEVTQEMIYGVTLVPRTPGKLAVPSAFAILNGKPVRTTPMYVEVKNVPHVTGSARSQQPSGSLYDPQPSPQQRAEFGNDQFLRPGESARDKINQNIMVKVDVNKRTAVVGEPILVTYKLATRLRSQSKVVSQPSFTGATVIEMTTENPLPTRENINGRMYNVYVVRRVQLIPLQEGPLRIPEAAVENTVPFYSTGGISYRDLYYNMPTLPAEEVTVTTKSKPLELQIQPMPPMSAVGPAVFSGAVGSYDISISLARTTLETNSTNELVVIVQGEGNIQQMRPPTINWPNGIEAFEPAVKTQEDKAYFPIRSRRTYAYPFVVNNPGQYVLPAISFTYFDASANRYITKQTNPVTLLVSKGAGGNKITSTHATADEDFQNRLIILSGAALLAIIIGLIWFKDRNRKTTQPAVAPPAPVDLPVPEAAPASASAILMRIRELCPEQDTALFYKQLYGCINEFFEKALKINPNEVQAHLYNYNGNRDAVQKLAELRNNCTLGMYTPVYTIDEAMQHRLTAIETISRLEREV